MILPPTQIFATRVAALFLVAGLALGASGCGRKGPLEPPPNPSATATPSDDLESEGHHKAQPITPPKAPFVLDPIL
ncbi:MAG: lipoprotein [Roseiarcus sp.]